MYAMIATKQGNQKKEMPKANCDINDQKLN